MLSLRLLLINYKIIASTLLVSCEYLFFLWYDQSVDSGFFYFVLINVHVFYISVFDDGDETTLRRTSLCLKSGRHFAESPVSTDFLMLVDKFFKHLIFF